jgi:hypothetical protein
MAGNSKLDQSLDTIMGEAKTIRPRAGGRNPRARRGGNKANPATAAPTGGVQKKTKPKAAPAPAVKPPPGDSKIIVSNLPGDVTEQQLKVR